MSENQNDIQINLKNINENQIICDNSNYNPVNQTEKLENKNSQSKNAENNNINEIENLDQNKEEIIDINKINEEIIPLNNFNDGNNTENDNNKKDDKIEKVINTDYYNEFNIPKYNEIVDYENKLKEEIEKTTPLISEIKEIQTLIDEYKDSIFSKSIQEVSKKYKFIRYARRDGNCFYRSFIYRLFEHCAINSDDKTFKDVIGKIENAKDLLEFNGYQWDFIEDYYTMFINEFKLLMTLTPEDKKSYLQVIFQDKEKGNCMIAFVRLYMAAYIKENRYLYENFIFDEDLDSFVRREVEPIDVECDNLQIIAITNCFNVGVLIENLGEKKIESMKLPEEGCNKYFTHLFFRPGHYDILYNN